MNLLSARTESFRVHCNLLIPLLCFAFAGCRNSSIQRDDTTAVPAAGTPSAKIKSNGKVLVFRNVPSWNRKTDFEDVLTYVGLAFDVKPASAMKATDLRNYRLIIIPGAQWETDFYREYNHNYKRFDDYVANGGTLVFELNGAEDSDLA